MTNKQCFGPNTFIYEIDHELERFFCIERRKWWCNRMGDRLLRHIARILFVGKFWCPYTTTPAATMNQTVTMNLMTFYRAVEQSAII